MKTQHLLYIITVGVGVLIGLLINRQQPQELTSTQPIQVVESSNTMTQTPENTLSLHSIRQEVETLKIALAEESEARQLLNSQLALLQGSVDTTEPKERPRKNKIVKTSSRPRVNPGNDGWINADLLISAGIDELDVKRITSIFETSEMEKLYLRDKAIREGWTGTSRFREEMSALRSKTDNLREELSEHDYDAYLYATGSPNRVIVKSALSNSPASLAGILPGDTIYKYDGVRVYTWADLRKETAKGNADEMVPLQILRENKNFEMFIKRGPLGIRLDHRSLSPAG